MYNTNKLIIPAMIIAIGIVTAFAFKPAAVQTYEYRQFSTIESIVPGGIGRSRLVSTDASGAAIEKDLLNIYSMVGINFSNIANNDKLIVDKINEYTNLGWELTSITAGVQSPSEKSSGGIYMTRYLFRKAK